MSPLVSSASASTAHIHVNARRPVRLQAGDQPIERNEQKQAEVCLGNDEARKEKRPDGGEHAEPGIETGAIVPRRAAPTPMPARQGPAWPARWAGGWQRCSGQRAR
jgi:hypothetical protein